MNAPHPIEPSSPPSTLLSSLRSSFGEIVFGMEDGTVSIFGLVAGLAAGAESGSQVVLAGFTGAIAAAVSMAAGVFLDEQSSRDQARVAAQMRRRALVQDPQKVVERFIESAAAARLEPATLEALSSDLRAHPDRVLSLTEQVVQRVRPTQGAGVTAHAAWMFVADLLAGLTPVLPFAFLPFDTARWTSIGVTLAMLVALGIGQARVGERAVLPTIAETVGIAGAAAAAGVLVAHWLA